jgi:hypothetical protein
MIYSYSGKMQSFTSESINERLLFTGILLCHSTSVASLTNHRTGGSNILLGCLVDIIQDICPGKQSARPRLHTDSAIINWTSRMQKRACRNKRKMVL